jgi:hypothetical protein
MKKLLSGIITTISCLGILPNANATMINASSLTFSVYKMAVSTSPLCTNLITVLDNGNSPTAVDFLTNPNLGNGVVADGTYPCIVIEFADYISFKPSATSGACVLNTTYYGDICRNNTSPVGTSKLIDGTTTNCGALGTSDRVAMYLSTGSSATGNDAFNPPTSIGDTVHGLNLATALTISGTSSGKFVVNTTGKVDDASACGMNPPAFSFSKL